MHDRHLTNVSRADAQSSLWNGSYISYTSELLKRNLIWLHLATPSNGFDNFPIEN